MEKRRELSDIDAILMAQAKSLHDLANQMLALGSRIMNMTGIHSEAGLNLKIKEDFPPVISFSDSTNFSFCDSSEIEKYNDKAAGNIQNKFLEPADCNTSKAGPANIIPFPRPGLFTTNSLRAEPGQFRKERFQISVPFLAKPGNHLPSGIPDYRPFLQRDGLILLAWDKRITESGERYTAYWVTSCGIPRFYASKPCSSEDFLAARPDHKSYAAEDGIEFYGQEAPVYIIHVAPELMMSNPRHGELRLVHIQLLKNLDIVTDFDYKYLLTAEKKRNLPFRKYKDENLSLVDA